MTNDSTFLCRTIKFELIKIFLFLAIISNVIYSQSNNHTPYWNHKVSMFKTLPNTVDEIIFLGDSITDRCEWFELFSNVNVKNRGLSGDNTSGVLDRLTEITESNPKKVFIMIGVNDLRYDIHVDTIVSNYTKIVKRIISESPSTQIILQSCLPINNEVGVSKTVNWRILNLNSRITTLAAENGLQYVEINSHLIDDKQNLDAKYTEDGLHINGDGYNVWKSIVEEYVND